MFTSEDYERKAADLWTQFTRNERDLVSIGVFPASHMDETERLGYKTHPLVVALMKHRTTVPRHPD
jgi:hypothetical protein